MGAKCARLAINDRGLSDFVTSLATQCQGERRPLDQFCPEFALLLVKEAIDYDGDGDDDDDVDEHHSVHPFPFHPNQQRQMPIPERHAWRHR